MRSEVLNFGTRGEKIDAAPENEIITEIRATRRALAAERDPRRAKEPESLILRKILRSGEGRKIHDSQTDIIFPDPIFPQGVVQASVCWLNCRSSCLAAVSWTATRGIMLMPTAYSSPRLRSALWPSMLRPAQKAISYSYA